MRRAIALALSAAGLLALGWNAAQPARPISASLSLARKFWSANATTRALNSPLALPDRAFAKELYELDRTCPPARDVALVLPRGLPPERVEETRRTAAYILAPRRVLVRFESRGDDGRWRLEPLPEGGGAR